VIIPRFAGAPLVVSPVPPVFIWLLSGRRSSGAASR
jgi:hypothetical protein